MNNEKIRSREEVILKNSLDFSYILPDLFVRKKINYVIK